MFFTRKLCLARLNNETIALTGYTKPFFVMANSLSNDMEDADLATLSTSVHQILYGTPMIAPGGWEAIPLHRVFYTRPLSDTMDLIITALMSSRPKPSHYLKRRLKTG